MYSRVFWAKFRPDQSDEVVRVCRDAVPVFQGLPGFRRVTFLYDRGSGLGWTIALFDTEEQARSCVDHLQDIIATFGKHAVVSGDDPVTLGADTSFPMFEVVAEG